MAFTYDNTTNRGKVRLLIADTDSNQYIFEDAEIDAFLNMEAVDGTNSVYDAAALALETIASQQALIHKRIKIMDLSTDGVSVSKELRERAKELRSYSEQYFKVAEVAINDFSKRRIRNNRYLEGEL